MSRANRPRRFKVGQWAKVRFGNRRQVFRVAALHEDPDAGNYQYGVSDEQGVFYYIGGLRHIRAPQEPAP